MQALAKSNLRRRSSAWKTSVHKLLVKRPDAITKTRTTAKDPTSITPAMIMHHFADCIDTEHPPLIVCDGGEFGQWVQAGLPDPLAITAHTLPMAYQAVLAAELQAIGTAIANPDRHVVAFMGDGSSGFTRQNWKPRRAHRITFIIGNDYRWGAEVEIQKNRYGEDRVHACDLDAGTRYDLIAAGFGVKGVLVDHPDQMASAMHDAMAYQGVSVINILMAGIAAPSF